MTRRYTFAAFAIVIAVLIAGVGIVAAQSTTSDSDSEVATTVLGSVLPWIVLVVVIVVAAVMGISVRTLLNSPLAKAILEILRIIAEQTKTKTDDQLLSILLSAGQLKIIRYPDGTSEIVPVDSSPNLPPSSQVVSTSEEAGD